MYSGTDNVISGIGRENGALRAPRLWSTFLFFFFFAVVHAVYRDQSRPRKISRLSGLETLYRSVSYKSYFLCCVCFVKYIEKDGGRVEQGVRVKRGG